MLKKTIKDIDLQGRRVLLRADYNVPVNEEGLVQDDFRIRQSLPTIRYLLDQNCTVVIISHLGRPDGKHVVPHYSLQDVAHKLGSLLDRPVQFVSDCVGKEVETATARALPGDVLLLENLRFYAAEEENDDAFGHSLSVLGEIFVQDGFGVVHRAHASTDAVTRYMPSVSGLLLEQEVDTITNAMEAPERPLVTIMGGAKISDKIELLDRFLNQADRIIVGGAMANTFLAANGYNVGKSLYEADQLETARHLIGLASSTEKQFLLPLDVVVTNVVSAAGSATEKDVQDVEDDDIIVDIGPKSSELFSETVRTSATVIWNGPVGVSEIPQFARGSTSLAEAIASAPGKSVLGGGDTAAFVESAGLKDKFDFISTGGGASLELMSGRELPGVKALLDK